MYIRNCPKCENEIKHKCKYNCRDAVLEGRFCKSCMLKGRSQRELYGDAYEDIILKRSQSLKEVEHWWQKKIVDSRKVNGSYKHSEKRKKQIAEQTIFSKTGKDHVRVKKILKELDLTWEEYSARYSEYKKYQKKVIRLTNKQDVSKLPNFDKRGKAGVAGAYQLDHILEISEGFVKGIDPEIIADMSNLQFIPWLENLKKRKYPSGIQNSFYNTL